MPSITGWFRPKLETECLVIRSLIYDVTSHFLSSQNHTARCIGAGCELCDLYPQVRSWVCAVSKSGDKRVYVFEFRDRHSELVEKLQIQGAEVIGTKIFVSKEEDSRHSAIDIQTKRPKQSHLSDPVTKAEVTEVYCRNYVNAIGMRQYHQAVSMLRFEEDHS